MYAPDIRPTTEADLPAITAIYQQAVREGTATFELEPPDLAEMTRRYRTLIDGLFLYFVAIFDGRVAGYPSAVASSLVPEGPPPTRGGRPTASRSRTRSFSIRPFTAAGSALSPLNE